MVHCRSLDADGGGIAWEVAPTGIGGGSGLEVAPFANTPSAGGGGSFWHRLLLSEAVGGCSPCLHDAVASPIVSAVCVLSNVRWRLMRDDMKKCRQIPKA